MTHGNISGRSTTELLLAFDGSREINVLFNDALNTFYLRLYGVRHMVKDHYDSEKGNPLLLSINSKGSSYAPSHRQDNTYHGLCYTSRGALAGTTDGSKSDSNFIHCLCTLIKNEAY